MKRFYKLISSTLWKFILIVFLFSACQSQQKVMILQDKAGGKPKTSFENKKKTTYQIQSGDHLYIRIYSTDPKTSKFFQTDLPTLMNPTYLYLNSYMIDEEGYINFSFIDRMFVKGMTLEEVKKKLQKTLNEYFNETTVIIKLVNFQISILGEVNSPGNFTIDKEQLNLFQALALSGGPKEFANINKVALVRQTLKGSEIYYFDLADKNILESEYFYLVPNDIIYVEPRKSKSYLVTSFPYTAVLSIVTLAVTMAVYLKVIK